MNTNELLAMLPREEGSSAVTGNPAQERLREILEDLALRPVPVGSLHRLWTLSELSAQIAMAYGVHWLRQCFVDAEESQRLLLEANLRVGLKIFHRLGYLRGAMSKIGQAAGHLPLLLPAQVAEILDALHTEAPPMHYSLIAEVLRNEFGRGTEEVFAGFDKQAFAAASLGQVHRARLESGEEVAVKVQYPGIGRTITADFRNLNALLAPMRLGRDWESIQAHFTEVQRMLEQEVDYLQEAESTRRARALFGEKDGIVVPQVFGAYSGKRVLTTEYLEGLHLAEYLSSNPSQESRNAFGTKLCAAWHRMYFAGVPYADPNPGNFLFLRDGRLAILDFGCVQQLNEAERALTRLADRMSFDDPTLSTELVLQVCGVAADDPAFPDYLQMMEDSRDWMLEPMAKAGAFDFGDASHFQRGLDWFQRTNSKRLTRANPMYVFFNRSIFGLKAMLYRLGAQVDVAAVIQRERPPRG